MNHPYPRGTRVEARPKVYGFWAGMHHITRGHRGTVTEWYFNTDSDFWGYIVLWDGADGPAGAINKNIIAALSPLAALAECAE